MLKLLTLSILVLVTGCAGNGSRLPPEELTFHALNAIDAAQTIHIARSPECFREEGFPTRQVLGEHPDTEGVLPLFFLYSVGHYYANRWFDDRPDLRTWQNVFNWSLIGVKAYTIADNHDQGIDPFGSGCP